MFPGEARLEAQGELLVHSASPATAPSLLLSAGAKHGVLSNGARWARASPCLGQLAGNSAPNCHGLKHPNLCREEMRRSPRKREAELRATSGCKIRASSDLEAKQPLQPSSPFAVSARVPKAAPMQTRGAERGREAH